MNQLSLISVGIPTYNRPDSLREVLNCITKQTYSNLEIVVSDNYSTNDDVQNVLEKFKNLDNRIKSFRQEKNIGLANNFQFVLSQASGDFFIWVSDDDLLELNYIECTYNAMKDLPDYNLVMGKIALYTPDRKFINYIESTKSIELPEPEKRVYNYFKNIDISGYFYGLYRTALLKEIGYTNKMMGADILVSIITIFSGKVKVVDTTAYKYFTGGGSVDHERLAKIVGLTQWHAVFFGFYDTYKVAQAVMHQKVFKRISFLKRLKFCIRCSLLMFHYTHAWHSSFIVVKRKILRKVLGRAVFFKKQN